MRLRPPVVHLRPQLRCRNTLSTAGLPGPATVGGGCRVGPTMTSTLDPHPDGGCDDPAAVLGCAGAEAGRGRGGWKGDDGRGEVGVDALRDSLVGPVETGTSPRCRWVVKGARGGGVRGRRVRRRPRPVHRVRAPLPGPRRRGPLPAPALLGPLRGRSAAGVAARVIAERTLRLSPHAAAFVDTHVAPVAHKIGPAQLNDSSRGQGPVRPRQTEADRQAAAEPRRFDSTSPRSVGRDRAPRGRPRPRRRPRPQHRPRRRRPPAACSAPPSPSTCAAPSPPATWPAPTAPRPHRPTTSRQQPSRRAGGAARPPRTRRGPRRRRARPDPGDPARSPPSRSAWCATRTPTSPSNRSWTWPSTSRSPPTKPPPGSSPDPAPRRHLRLPLLLPPRRRLRLRTPRPPRPDDRGPTCTCNLAPCCRPPPRQDHRRLDLRHRRTRRLPVAEPARLPVPPRPHRHPRRHPRR